MDGGYRDTRMSQNIPEHPQAWSFKCSNKARCPGGAPTHSTLVSLFLVPLSMGFDDHLRFFSWSPFNLFSCCFWPIFPKSSFP